jgi:hypothetical protein
MRGNSYSLPDMNALYILLAHDSHISYVFVYYSLALLLFLFSLLFILSSILIHTILIVLTLPLLLPFLLLLF